MKKATLTVWTLADIKASGWIIVANCCGRDCGRGREVSVDLLIQRFGAAYPIIGDDRIGRRLRCACGHLGGRFTFRPRGGKD